MSKKIFTQKIAECNTDIYDKLYSLNFREYGVMRKALVNAKKYNNGLVIYIIEKNIILAWAIVYKHKNDPQKYVKNQYKIIFPHVFEVHFYVRKQYRNMGFGKILYKKAKNICKRNNKKMKVMQHDVVSKAFFKSMRKL